MNLVKKKAFCCLAYLRNFWPATPPCKSLHSFCTVRRCTIWNCNHSRGCSPPFSCSLQSKDFKLFLFLKMMLNYKKTGWLTYFYVVGRKEATVQATHHRLELFHPFLLCNHFLRCKDIFPQNKPFHHCTQLQSWGNLKTISKYPFFYRKKKRKIQIAKIKTIFLCKLN